MACLSLSFINNKKKYILAGAFFLLTIVLCIGICIGILIESNIEDSKRQSQPQPTSQYFVEIGVENHSSHPLKVVQFGIINGDGRDSLLDCLHYEKEEIEDPAFWITYHEDTVFFLKVETDMGWGRVDFDLHGKENVEQPQKKMFFVTEEDSRISISAGPEY